MIHEPKLLDLVELKLREVISREPTLLVMVVGVPNVGKSALINSIHQIASSLFPSKTPLCLASYRDMSLSRHRCKFGSLLNYYFLWS